METTEVGVNSPTGCWRIGIYKRTEKRRMVKERKAAGIKTWPEDDRPREKLLKNGARKK